MKRSTKEERRRKHNRGFSLVELLVVIAIMAVLVAVTAPQFTKYVDRSRQAVDATTVANVVSAAQVGVADVVTYPDITSGTYVITIDESGTKVTGGTGDDVTTPGDTAVTAMTDAIEDVCGDLDTIKATAKAWKDTGIVINITVGGNVTVEYVTEEFKNYIGIGN